MPMQRGDAHIVFNGQSRKIKFFIVGATQPAHVWDCHDVGVNDDRLAEGADVYGHLCKCPPGLGYVLGAPQILNPPERAYGGAFTPINDNADGTFVRHGRSGLGIHGGGSDLGDPFAPRQGWEWTFGCLRLQNEDNASFVEELGKVFAARHSAFLDVVWP